MFPYNRQRVANDFGQDWDDGASEMTRFTVEEIGSLQGSRKRIGAPGLQQSMKEIKEKKPRVFNDPFSALAAYMGHQKMNVTYSEDRSINPPCVVAFINVDGITFKARGESMKEAKQRLAVILLREKFSMDASELFQHYMSSMLQNTIPSVAKGQSSLSQQTFVVPNRMAIQAQTQRGIGGLATGVHTRRLPVPQTTGRMMEDFASDDLFEESMNFKPSFTSRMGMLPQSTPMQDAAMEKLPAKMRLGAIPASNRLGPANESSYSTEFVTTLIAENKRLKHELNTLKKQHEAIGAVANDISDELFEKRLVAQGEIEANKESIKEFINLAGENKILFAYLPCTGFKSNVFYGGLHFRLDKKIKVTFYGKGSNKEEIRAMACSAALKFLKRHLAGENVIAPNMDLIQFLTIYAIKKANKDSEVKLNWKECIAISQDDVLKEATAKLTIENVTVEATGPSKAKARDNAIIKYMEANLGFVTF